jgi:hypothetical protein
MTDVRRLTTTRPLLLLALLVLLLTACAEQDEGPGTTADPASAAPEADEAVIQVTYVGGFTTPAMNLSRLPLLTVYGDGRVITQGAQIAIYPAPALPSIEQRRIERADIDRLVRLALDAGVGHEDLDLGTPPIADAASTRFTVRTNAAVRELEVYALEETEASQLTEDQQAARQRLRELLASLTDPEAVLGAGSVQDSEQYAPEALAAVVEPWVDPGDAMTQPEVAWPGPALPGQPLDEALGLTCVDVTGDDVGAVLDAAAGASSATPWTSGGQRWTVTLRPLLPDESGCADLAGVR